MTLLSVPGQPGKHPAWLSAEEKSLSVLYEGRVGASNSCTEGRRCLLDFGRAGGGLMPLRGIVREGRLSLPGRWKAEDGVGRCFEISSDGTLAPALLLSPGL